MYAAVDPTLRARRGISGWFGCDVDEDDVRKKYRVPISRGKWNIWIVARAPDAKESIEDIVDDWLDPVDTEWFSDPPVEITQLHQGVPQAMAAIQQYKSMVKGPSGVFTGPGKNPSDATWYFVSFLAPASAPAEIPWPFEGCPEEVKWLVTNALEPVTVAKAREIAAVAEAEATAADPATVEAQRQKSLDFLRAGRAGISDGGTLVKPGGLSLTSKLLISGAIVGGAWFFAKSRGLLPQQRPLRQAKAI